jgi:hypothetical protein
MRFKPFVYSNNELSLNDEQILLLKEFRDVWEDPRNQTKKDPTGRKKLWAFKVFKFLYLELDYKSVLIEYSTNERRKYALQEAFSESEVTDLGIGPIGISDPILDAAYKKYEDLNNPRLVKLCYDAYTAVDNLRVYFQKATYTQYDDNGRLRYNPKDTVANISNLGKMVEGLQILENQIKKEMDSGKGIRGDQQPGLFID